jgi:hypothetical protein
MKSTNYFNAFITVSSDCPTTVGREPANVDSVAGLQFRLLQERPYSLTSDELLFEVYALRNGVTELDRGKARNAFFSKPQACLRASPLVKKFGWGLHHDEAWRIAAYGVETKDYKSLAACAELKVISGMRSRKS